MNIYNILFPAESDFVGWVQFATLTKDKRMVSLGYSDFEHIEEVLVILNKKQTVEN